MTKSEISFETRFHQMQALEFCYIILECSELYTQLILSISRDLKKGGQNFVVITSSGPSTLHISPYRSIFV